MVRVPDLQPLLGPEFKSRSDRELMLFLVARAECNISATLVNSQLVCLPPDGHICNNIKILDNCNNCTSRKPSALLLLITEFFHLLRYPADSN